MNEFVFTAAGQQLVSRMIAGEATAAFTRVETSDHEYTKSEVEMLTALADVKQEVLISKVTRIDSAKVELLIALDNQELRETYSVKAIGVYARDSDQQEILFGVAVNTDAPDPMPVLAGKTISELTYHLVLAVAVSDQIDISVNPSAGATVEQLEELEGDVNEKVEQLLEKTRSLQDELENVQKELLGMVKQTAIVNNNTTTEAGFALDARQANPNIAGTLAATVAQLNNDSMATDIEWTDRIQKSGVYRVTVNESSRYAAAKYLPYDTDGNIGDIWIVNAIAFNSRYIGLYAIQLNANRSGFGRLDTETLNMSWNN